MYCYIILKKKEKATVLCVQNDSLEPLNIFFSPQRAEFEQPISSGELNFCNYVQNTHKTRTKSYDQLRPTKQSGVEMKGGGEECMECQVRSRTLQWKISNLVDKVLIM